MPEPNPNAKYDLTGKVFGRLAVIGRAPNDRLRNRCWECRCVCGEIRIVIGRSLRNGHSQSCGCLNREIVGQINFVDLTGRVFERWTVIERIGSDRKGSTWLCLCACGNRKVVTSRSLLHGQSKSCGCLQREVASRSATLYKFVHGESHSPTYNSWSAMIQRCTNPNDPAYYRYGGCGITVCDRWLTFTKFFCRHGRKTGW
jgi:hypothetical protein